VSPCFISNVPFAVKVNELSNLAINVHEKHFRDVTTRAGIAPLVAILVSRPVTNPKALYRKPTTNTATTADGSRQPGIGGDVMHEDAEAEIGCRTR
jgi:hypothetical protein